MFSNMSDKEKAAWLRDNLASFWANRYPNATLGGDTSDLLIDIEQQLAIDALQSVKPAAKVTTIVEKLVQDDSLAQDVSHLAEKVADLNHEIKLQRENLSGILAGISPANETVNVSIDLSEVHAKIKKTDNSLSELDKKHDKFVNMGLTDRMKWVLFGVK